MTDEERADLAENNLDLIKIILNQTRKNWRNWNYEDVYAAAFDGYSQAVLGYVPDRGYLPGVGAGFRKYAEIRIRGAITNFFQREATQIKAKERCGNDWPSYPLLRKKYYWNRHPDVHLNLDTRAFRRGMVARGVFSEVF